LTRRALLVTTSAALCLPALAAEPMRGLRDIAQARGLQFGSMVRGRWLAENRAYADMMVRECGVFVCREAHFGYLERRRGEFDFSQVEKDRDWAEAHRMKLRLHALVWGENAPTWFGDIGDRSEAVRVFEEFIQRACGRFAGRVDSWDVVNEAIKVEHGRADGLRQTVFLDAIGPEIEANALFPNRTNVSFLEIDGDRVRARIFERGVGETLSSGTGASGAAVTAHLLGVPGPIVVELEGGELEVEIGGELEVRLTGWAEPVCSGELSPELLTALSELDQ